MSDGTLEALDRILDGGGEPDDVLREVVDALAAVPGTNWAGIAFLEEDALVLGPHAGTPSESGRTKLPVVYEGVSVGELWVDGKADPALLEHVATLVAPFVLIGWDTQGETWEP